MKTIIGEVEVETRVSEIEHIYKAVPSGPFWGQGDGIAFVTGVTLERVSPAPDYEKEGWDPIFDEIAEYGEDAQIVIPEEGLVLGALYKAVTKSYRDWESGIIDDWETFLYRVTEDESVVKQVNQILKESV
jgi:hypothetical protein